MSLPVLAQHMAAKGRGPDSMLVHMSPQEVAGLHALALKHGGSLTINPETGLVEAGFLSSILPMVAGFALDAFAPGFGTAISGALGITGAGAAAIGTGIGVGGLTGLATGSLSKGLTAGLGAYGGAGLNQGLMGAGQAALGTDAFNAANTLNAGNPAAVQAAVEDRIANATFGEKLSAGFDAAKANPMGFIKPNAGILAAAAAPVVADQMVPTTVKAPPLPPAYIRPFQFDENTRTVTAQTPVLASEWGARSFPDYIPKRMAGGGMVAFADGGAADDPYAKYNTLTGQSKAAYDYLMGNAAYPTGPVVTPRVVDTPVVSTTEPTTPVTPPPRPPIIVEPPVVTPPVVTPPKTLVCGPGYHEENGVCVPDVAIPPVVTTTPDTSTGTVITDTGTTTTTPGTTTTTTTGTPGTGTPGTGTPGTGTVPGTGGPSTTPGTGVETLLPGAGGTSSTGTTVTSGGTGGGTAGTGGAGTGGSGITGLTGSSGLSIPTTTPATTTGTPGAATKGTDAGIATLTGGESGVQGGTMGGEREVTERQFGDYRLDPTKGDVKVVNPNDKVWGTVEVTPVGGDIFQDPDNYQGGYYSFTTPGTGGGSTGGGKPVFEETAGSLEFAHGGMASYAMGGGLGTLGGYSDGGRLLKGPGDGVSDSIPATIGRKQQPARLADGEFVIPARIVSELGNGSTDAGARKLYAMMDRIQKARGKTVGKGKVAANSRAEKHLPA